MDEKRISEIMNALECSREEALQIIADDDAIEHGEKLFEISQEQKKVVKSMTKTGTKKQTTPAKRERKADFEKQEIIQKIANALQEFDNYSVEISNTEREIKLKINSNNYSIVLTKHRPPKK